MQIQLPGGETDKEETVNLLAKCRKFRLSDFIERNPRCKFCPTKDCSSVVFVREAVKTIEQVVQPAKNKSGKTKDKLKSGDPKDVLEALATHQKELGVNKNAGMGTGTGSEPLGLLDRMKERAAAALNPNKKMKMSSHDELAGSKGSAAQASSSSDDPMASGDEDDDVDRLEKLDPYQRLQTKEVLCTECESKWCFVCNAETHKGISC